MSFVLVKSLSCQGLQAAQVSVEVLRSRGLSSLRLSGLADLELRDSQDKIRALVSRIGKWDTLDRILVNLLPAERVKNGAHLELPIALGCLAALSDFAPSNLMMELLERYTFVGALNLSGALESTGSSRALELAYPDKVIGPLRFSSLAELWQWLLDGNLPLPQQKIPPKPKAKFGIGNERVIGLEWERCWLSVAAIAELPVALIGPPGSGKSTLAKWAHQLIPSPIEQVLFERQQILSLAGLVEDEAFSVSLTRPHSRTPLSEFIGTINRGLAKPGLFSLSHGGLLIMDEFLEFNRDCREILRTILDQKRVSRNTSQGSISWPASFWLIATMNPCSCGYALSEIRSECLCAPGDLRQYQARFSGPILDRFGLCLFVDNQESSGGNSRHISFFPRGLLDEDPERIQNRILKARNDREGLLDEALGLCRQVPSFSRRSVREIMNKGKMLAALSALSGQSLEFSLDMLIIQSAVSSRSLKAFGKHVA